jgi:hypothetical protein
MANRVVAPSGFENVHRILGKAMRQVDATAWPAWGHGGGPLIVLSSRAQVRVGIDLAAHVDRQFAMDDQARACVELAREAVDLRDVPPAELRKGLLLKAHATAKSDGASLRFAKLVLRAAKNLLFAAPSASNAAGTAIETAVAMHVETIDDVTEFLRAVDQALMRYELRGFLDDKQLVATSPILNVIARAPTTDHKLGCVLATLEDGQFGLYTKLRARWEWHEGDLATMFATVPDALHDGVGRGIATHQLR